MGGRSWCNSKPYRVMVKSDISATELIFSRFRWSKFGFCSTSKFKKKEIEYFRIITKTRLQLGFCIGIANESQCRMVRWEPSSVC